MAKLELLSRTIYDANGVQTVWDFNFAGGYILPEHVKAYYELGAVRTEVAASLIGANQVYINPAVPAGAVLTIYRDTPKNAPLVDFVDRGTVSEVALDTIAKQAVFAAAESSDSASTGSVDVAVAAASVAQASALAAAGSATSAETSKEEAESILASIVSTVGSAITSLYATLAGWGGAALIGFKQLLPGSVQRTVAQKLGEAVSVNDFGAVGGVADDTVAFNKAILAVTLAGGGVVMCPSPSYTLLGKVLVPSNVRIDLCKSVIYGSTSSTLFETGYLDGGVIVTNIGAGNETRAIYGSKIHNGTIRNSALAFNAFNFLAGCEFSDIILYDCIRNVYAKRCFYNAWKNIYSANTVNSPRTGIPAWTFDDNNNAVTFDRVFTTGRDIAYLFKGAMFLGKISGLSAEGGVNGIIIENETFALEISNNYFEELSGTALDLTYPAQKTNLVIEGNFFHGPGVGVRGQLLIGGSIGAGNTFSGCSSNVIITDDLYSSITVHIPSNGDSNVNGFTPALPAEYTLGKKVQVVGFSNIYNNANGMPMINAQMTNGLVSLLYNGDSGMVDGKIPFCTHVSSSPGSSSFNVLVNTRIVYNPYAMLIFKIRIGANVARTFSGRVYGTTVFLDENGGGLTASADIVGGFIQLQLNGLTNAGGAYSAEGIVRII